MAAQDIGIPDFIDSHAHLADPAFAGDRGEVIERARSSGALAVVCIGSGSGADEVLASARESADLAGRYPGYLYYSAGVHPHDASGFDPSSTIDQLRELVTNGAVGIGECGLDYHYDNSPRAEQRRAFAEQLRLARELDTPVIVHTRDAEDDTKAMIREAASAGVVGLLHCFTGTRALAEAAIEAGWLISFSGIVTFKKWSDDEIIRMVPEDRILAESDSPYLAPVPNRGKRNEPSWVSYTVARLADARGVSVEAMSSTVCANATRVFKLASSAQT
ncbi:MAG TPA: TatD family hydrolase [Gemmatimonadaceae bacterium]|nr:TatD family hydrolase [Gemmatimonadaceae bacterium]